MFRKILVIGFSFGLLAACDNELGNETTIKNVAPEVSSTSIFLPGGGGIDFGVSYKVIVSKNAAGKAISKTYILELDYPYTEIEKAVDSVLIPQGYVKNIKAISDESKAKNVKSIRHYTKKDDLAVFVLSANYSEGFKEKTKVSIWQRI